jgi:hypothetical protein
MSSSWLVPRLAALLRLDSFAQRTPLGTNSLPVLIRCGPFCSYHFSAEAIRLLDMNRTPRRHCVQNDGADET